MKESKGMQWQKHPENDKTGIINTFSAYIWIIIPLWFLASPAFLPFLSAHDPGWILFHAANFLVLWTAHETDEQASQTQFVVHKFRTCLVYHNTHLRRHTLRLPTFSMTRGKQKKKQEEFPGLLFTKPESEFEELKKAFQAHKTPWNSYSSFTA